MSEFSRHGESESIKIEYETTDQTESQLIEQGWRELTSWHKKLWNQEEFANQEALRYKNGGFRVVGIKCDDNPYPDDIIWSLYGIKEETKDI